MEQLNQYFEKVLTGINTICGVFIAVISYLMFPDKAFETAAVAVGIAMLCDILTKMYAYSKQAHGFRNAIKTGKIASQTLWEKTKIKLISYLVIGILTGLSYRVVFLEVVGVAFGTTVYAVIFVREFISNLENLRDAGADVGWLIKWSKKKEKKILEEENIDDASQ